jgi:drug/metabolite transporter (DMT)-like permease
MNPKLSLVIGIICISFSPIFVKLADAPPVICALYRIIFAWLLLLPYCLYKRNLKMARKDVMLALLGGVIFASDITVWNLSLKLINATVSTLVSNLAPVWVGLISYFLFRKKSGSLFWIGTGVAIGGMVVLVGLQNLLHLQFGLGLIYAVAASLLYSIYILITKDVLKRISTIPFMFYNMLAACIYLLAISLVTGTQLFNYSTSTWLCFAGMGVFCQLAGWILLNHSISHMESTKVSISLLSQTVVAGVLAAFLLKESLELKEIVGSAIVLAGIAVTFLKPKASLV